MATRLMVGWPFLLGIAIMEERMDFQALAETIPHLIWSARADGVTDYYNARFLRYLGKSLEEMHGWNWADTLHPEDRQRCLDNWIATLKAGTEYFEEYRIRRGADGRYRWHEGRAVPLRDEAGKIIRWFGTCTDIEDRKQAERECELCSQFFKVSPDLMCIATPDGYFKKVNPSFSQLLGYTEQELLARPFVDFIHPDDVQLTLQVIARTPGGSFAVENRLLCKDGTSRWLSWTGHYCDDQQICYAVARNTTAQKTLEEQLKNSEDNYRMLHETMRDAFVSVDMTGQILEFNSAYRDLLGYSDDELRSKTYVDLTPAKWHAFEAQIVAEQIITKGFSGIYEKEYLRKDGTIVPIELRTALVRSATGEPKLMWAIIRDISARKRMEETLRNSEARYRAIVESQTEFVTRFLPGGIFTYANKALAQWHGLKTEDLIGKSFYPYIHENDREATIRKIEALSVADPRVTIEERVVSPDGKLCWHQWTNYAFFDEEGHVVEYQAVGRDITEKKEAEICLAKAKETLEHEVRERTAALTLTNEQLTHEIDERKRIEQHLVDYQRKLEDISLELTLATDRERGRIAEELHDDVGQRLILSRIKLDALASQLSGRDHELAVKAIQELIDKILNDIRSMTFQLRPPILAGAGLVAAVQWLVEDLKEKYGLRIEVEYDTTPINLAYETKSSIFQVVRELLLNVAKHANTDRAIISVTTGANILNVTVTDYGIGFDAATANKKIGRTGGFGIFSIKQRIEHLDGTLTLESKPGEGSRATITVPLPSKDEQAPL
jgi:PAS domain S-box-containing protein